jgi:hypothetical protein
MNEGGSKTKKTRENADGKTSRERRQKNYTGRHKDRGRTNRREKQRVRPLYFVFSSSSRAPSSAVTAPETGHSRRKNTETRAKYRESNEEHRINTEQKKKNKKHRKQSERQKKKRERQT